MKSVLVTGAAGFIGSHVVEALLDRGDHVIGIDNFDADGEPRRKHRNVAEIMDHPAAERFVMYEMDIRDASALLALCQKHRPDAIVHLAALAGVRTSIRQCRRYFDVNVNGSLALLEAARETRVGQLVFASTSSVYGNGDAQPLVESVACDRPLSPYSASKRSVELIGAAYHHLHGLHFTALRFFTVYGPRNRPDMMAYKLLESITRGQCVPLYNGGLLHRDWTYVKDIAAGVVAAVDRPLGYEAINLGRGEAVLLKDFVSRLEDLAGDRAQLIDEPAPLADVVYTHACIDKARALLGYTPTTSVHEGARELWRWYSGQVERRGPELSPPSAAYLPDW
ncbi:MAG: SDR family NAD(P)-dependent oxidoreductase [Polyangiales bacterium]